jgi:hypothetical protein
MDMREKGSKGQHVVRSKMTVYSRRSERRREKRKNEVWKSGTTVNELKYIYLILRSRCGRGVQW